MAIKTSDTDPRLSSGRVREVLAHEAVIDKVLLQSLKDGRASVMVKVTDKETLDILLLRYRKNGWVVNAVPKSASQSSSFSSPFGSEGIFVLSFEDSNQLELTKPQRILKLNSVPGTFIAVVPSGSVTSSR
jgi:hypothetical protein